MTLLIKSASSNDYVRVNKIQVESHIYAGPATIVYKFYFKE